MVSAAALLLLPLLLVGVAAQLDQLTEFVVGGDQQGRADNSSGEAELELVEDQVWAGMVRVMWQVGHIIQHVVRGSTYTKV